MKIQEFIHLLIQEDPIKAKYTSRQRSLYCKKMYSKIKDLLKEEAKYELEEKKEELEESREELEATCEQLEEKQEELEESREELEDTCEQLEKAQDELEEIRVEMEHYRKSYYALKHRQSVNLECIQSILNLSILVYFYSCLYQWIKNSMQISQLQTQSQIG